MSDTVLRVENLGKKYIIGHQQAGRYTTLRDVIADKAGGLRRRVLHPFGTPNTTAPTIEEFWALKDVSFEVKRGERLGIIGRNGAGKSTLLKVLSRITEPSAGRVTIKGRVSSLLEVGTGFHPELTGRENIYLNGAILGMSRQEIRRKFDEIVDFSGVERFLDTPVKRYSSGMYVRLAFAVAAHLEPEILLVDEVLAVGDAAFQKKCLGKMEDVAAKGRTVLFVSHNMAAVEALCSRAYLLKEGKLASSGPAGQVITAYLSEIGENASGSLFAREDRSGSGRLRFTDVSLRGHDGNPVGTLVSGKDANIHLDFEARGPVETVSVSVTFYGPWGQPLLWCNNEVTGQSFNNLPAKGTFVCTVPKFPLGPGTYTLNLYCEVDGVLADWVRDAFRVTVIEGDFYGTGRFPPRTHSQCLAEHNWSFKPFRGGGLKALPNV